MAMQLSEGFAWLSFGRGEISSSAIHFAAVLYLLVSHLYWPIFPALGTFLMERDPRRRRLLQVFLLLSGALSAALLILDVAWHDPVSAQVVHRSIRYEFHEPEKFALVAAYGPYLLLVLILAPPLVSSLPYTGVLLAVTAGTFAIAQAFYREACISVWCFFATGASAVVFLMLHRLKEAGRRNATGSEEWSHERLPS
jgi:hypothetical protein